MQTFAKADAKMKYATYPVQTEDFASVLLRFSNGARGNLGVSQVAAGRKNCIRIEIYGSKKSAWWCSEEPEMLHFGNRDGANETAVRATPAFGDGAAGFMDYPPGHVEGFPDTFKMNFRAIYAAISGRPATPRLFATVRGRPPGSRRVRGDHPQPEGTVVDEGLTSRAQRPPLFIAWPSDGLK